MGLFTRPSFAGDAAGSGLGHAKSLSGLAKCRKQPERYAKDRQNVSKIRKNPKKKY
jgi:hypothetical protein